MGGKNPRVDPDVFQPMMALAYAEADQNLSVAWDVAFRAYGHGPDTYRTKVRRRVKPQQEQEQKEAGRRVKPRLPRAACCQLCLLAELDKYDRAQEEQGLQEELQETLTRKYVRFVLWQAMDWSALHTLMGVGSLIYRYKAKELLDLCSLDPHGNDRRPLYQLRQLLKSRFGPLGSRPATSEENVSIQQLFGRYTLWDSPHAEKQTTFLEDYFDPERPQPDLVLIHLITDPVCGGLASIIVEANQGWVKGKRLAEPHHKLEVPVRNNNKLSTSEDNTDVPTAPGARTPSAEADVNSPSLSAVELEVTQYALLHNERRKRQYRPGCLRVCVDGQEQLRFDVGAEAARSIAVPLTASYIEVFGDDAEGELSLAFFLLPKLEDRSRRRLHYQAPFGPGRSIALELTPDRRPRGTVAYAESVAEPAPTVASPPTASQVGANSLFTWPEVHAYSDALRIAHPTFLHGLFDAIQAWAARLPRDYDAVWPILELLEQMAVQVWRHPALQPVFIARYAALCLETPNTILQGALTWGINELLERGQQAPIGLEIARRLAQPPVDITVQRVLRILGTLRPPLRRFLTDQGCPLAPPDTETLRLRQLADAAIRHIDVWASTWTPTATALIFPHPAEMEQLISFWHATQSDRGIGIVAMGEMKRVLEAAVSSTQGDEALIRELCLFLLKKVDGDPHFPTFFAIEALEAVRDAAPASCARLMAEYLRDLQDITLAFGIAVCIAEGYEEGGEGSMAAPMRFVRSTGVWEAVVTAPELPEHNLDGLDGFFPLAAEVLNTRRDLDDVAEWMNRRLDLHPAIA